MEIIKRGEQKLGTKYSKMDCSDFVSWVYKDYVSDSTADRLASQTKGKCVKQSDVKPGDVFFTSRYNSGGNCTGCIGKTFGDRCSRWNCILHVGIVTEVSNGKVTAILHSSGSGVAYKNNPSYKSIPSSGGTKTTSGKAWYIMFTRPYA